MVGGGHRPWKEQLEMRPEVAEAKVLLGDAAMSEAAGPPGQECTGEP